MSCGTGSYFGQPTISSYTTAAASTSTGIQVSSPTPYFTSNNITIGSGTISTTASGLYWNNEEVMTRPKTSKPDIFGLSNILRDSSTKDIINCKSREECKDKYGSTGVEFFDSYIADILRVAIKSEEAFVEQCNLQDRKIEILKTIIKLELPDISEHRLSERINKALITTVAEVV